MARIRTIKPEFPQSESMGRVSRDARLLFVMLWTICDDHGRARAHSRMLASLLFPYDDDAGEGVKVWLKELEDEGCISLYEVAGSQYLQVTGWSKHQKIDKPSKPQFPGAEDTSRESSRESIEDSENPRLGRDQGREGRGESRGEDRGTDRSRGSRLPTGWQLPSEWASWAKSERPDLDIAQEGERFADYWHGVAGAKGRKADWQATWRNWIRNARGSPSGRNGAPSREPAALPELSV